MHLGHWQSSGFPSPHVFGTGREHAGQRSCGPEADSDVVARSSASCGAVCASGVATCCGADCVIGAGAVACCGAG